MMTDAERFFDQHEPFIDAIRKGKKCVFWNDDKNTSIVAIPLGFSVHTEYRFLSPKGAYKYYEIIDTVSEKQRREFRLIDTLKALQKYYEPMKPPIHEYFETYDKFLQEEEERKVINERPEVL